MDTHCGQDVTVLITLNTKHSPLSSISLPDQEGENLVNLTMWSKQPTFQTCSDTNPSELVSEMSLGLSDPSPAHTPQVHAVRPPEDHLAVVSLSSDGECEGVTGVVML